MTDVAVEDNLKYQFAVVGIGASAGGLRALEDFFENMPPDSGAAFVVVQHLSPDFKSLMTELLNRRTQMTVQTVTDGMRLVPNTIFLIPPGHNLALEGRQLTLQQQERGAGYPLNFPIDLFFQSLAVEAKERAIGIVLSGTGSDGTRGVKRMAELGGIVMAQAPETAEFDGMPQSAIATGLTDLILPAEELAQTTYQFVTSPQQRQELRQQQQGQLRPVKLKQIVSLLERHENIDFTHYKPSTLLRRIHRRSLISGFTNLDCYIEYLAETAAERDALCNDLLITVTSFFRDTAAWEELEQVVLPRLIHQADPDKGLRIWITACATGEEAYSMAILLKELIEKRDRPLEAKIFATDVDHIALGKASTGIYPAAISNSLSTERLSRFFKEHNDGYEISRPLREMIIFANHNLAKDAGFTQMDLVSCRNVLIYMQPDLQQQVLRSLHFSLKSKGILFLGESENLGGLAEEFEPLERKWKIYRKCRDVRLPLVNFSLGTLNKKKIYRQQQPAPLKFDPLLETALTALLCDRKATCFLVNRDNQLLHLCSDPLKLLNIAAGPATQDVLKMLPAALRLPLNTALYRAGQTGDRVQYSQCPLSTPSSQASDQPGHEPADTSIVSLDVSQQFSRSTGKFFMVVIEAEDRVLPDSPQLIQSSDSNTDQYVFQLQQELQATRENLQAAIEELETTNEEQQATNEELIASNEELQSTNEELHSVNEELYTVNSEHQGKIQELIELNNDIDNLLNNINIGVIYLDRSLKIRKFTPAATLTFNLVDGDIGRPLKHLSHNLEHFDVLETIEHADSLETAIEYATQIKRDGPHMLVQVRPYISDENTADGAILTLVNINEIQITKDNLAAAEAALRQTNEALEHKVEARTAELRSSQQLLESITKATPNAIYIYDLAEHRNVYANTYLETMLGYSVETIQKLGDEINQQLFHPEDLPKIQAHHAAIAQSHIVPYQVIDQERPGDRSVFDIEYRVLHTSGEWRYFYSKETVFKQAEDGKPIQILGTAIDITDRRATEIQLKRNEYRYRQLYQNTPVMMHSVSPTGDIISVSDEWLNHLGYTSKEVLSQPITRFLIQAPNDCVEPSVPQWLHPGGCHELPCQFICKDGTVLDILLSSVADLDDNSQVTRLLTVLTDVTQRKQAKTELKRYQGHLEELVAARATELKTTNLRLQAEVVERQQIQTELAQRAKDLERSNSDLEQFAYVISHDLQEPLRAMTVFSQLLSQLYSNQLDSTAEQYISNIVDGGIRMQALIDGILDFSRVANRGERFQAVHLGQSLGTALDNLQTAIASTQATITHDELPTLLVDSNQITQLFQNLIGNAIKFRSSETPLIHISARPQPEQNRDGSYKRWVFTVEDNGIGMLPEQQERIFALFQRLHTRKEIEGYGIGLAICKKIVERHQGRLWVESDLGKGSTFYFTLTHQVSVASKH